LNPPFGTLDSQFVLAFDRDCHIWNEPWLTTAVEVCGEGRNITLNHKALQRSCGRS
jgi:hypothetical protein